MSTLNQTATTPLIRKRPSLKRPKPDSSRPPFVSTRLSSVPAPGPSGNPQPPATEEPKSKPFFDLAAELAHLRAMPVRDLQARYQELWSAPTNSRNRDYLIKRIAWRIQEKEKGGLSDRAKQRLAEVLDDCALRIRPPKDFLAKVAQAPVAKGRRKKKAVISGLNPQPSPLRDPRLPQVGSELRRDYRGQQVVVQVLDQGFLFGTRFYPSLSAIARDVTGQNWNGFLFFGLTDRKVKA